MCSACPAPPILATPSTPCRPPPPPSTAPAPAPAHRVYPAPAQLNALRELVGLGYYRGILNQLDDIEQQQPATAAFVAELRGLARQFQFEAISQQLKQIPLEN